MKVKLSVLLAVLCLRGGVARAEDLLAVYRDAVKSDASYLGVQASYEATRERIAQGQALNLPNVSVTGNAGFNRIDDRYQGATTLPQGNISYGSWGGALNLVQSLFRRSNDIVIDEAQLQVVQAAAQLAYAGQDLMVRVCQGYFDVLLARDNLVSVRAQKAAIAEQLAQAQRNFQVGTATITDTYDAKARYDLVVAQEIAGKNDVEVKRRALQLITGKVPGELHGLAGPVRLSPPQPADLEAWVKASYDSSLQVAAARAGLGLAGKEIDRLRYTGEATVDALAGAGYANQTNSNLGVAQHIFTGTVGLQLNYPLYTGGAITARVREAVANKTKAEMDLEGTRRTVAQAVRQSYLNVEAGLAEISALEQARASTQLSVDASKLGLQVGVRTQVDVLNAQQLLYSAERDLAKAYYTAIIDQLRLKASSGRLTEKDLERVNSLLSAKAREGVLLGEKPAVP